MSGLDGDEFWGEGGGGEADGVDDQLAAMTNEEIRQTTQMLDNQLRIVQSDINVIQQEAQMKRERIKENNEKIKLNKTLPYLVANVVEVLELPPEEDEEDGASTDVDAQRKGKSAVVKTSTRQTIFLPIPGLVDADKLEPGDLILTGTPEGVGPVYPGDVIECGITELGISMTVPIVEAGSI